jgi:hypothetical protein
MTNLRVLREFEPTQGRDKDGNPLPPPTYPNYWLRRVQDIMGSEWLEVFLPDQGWTRL